MATKLRIIIVKPDGTIKWGGDAIQYMFVNFTRHLSQTPLPNEWKKWSKKDKMLWLMRFMPPSHKLFLLREPKWTRKKLSKYKQLITGEGVGIGGGIGGELPPIMPPVRRTGILNFDAFNSVARPAITAMAYMDESDRDTRVQQPLLIPQPPYPEQEF